MSDNIYANESYKVVIIDDALGEDGQYGRMGYAVVNIETGVVEHTTTALPQALFQADAFQGALGQLKAQAANEDGTTIDGDAEDIVIN